MITHSYKNNYDVAILVAGDNDFAGAVQAVKDNGKHVEVALFGKQGTSQQLRAVADMIIMINARVLRDCWNKQMPGPRNQPSRPFSNGSSLSNNTDSSLNNNTDSFNNADSLNE
jgi:hypothetical protein